MFGGRRNADWVLVPRATVWFALLISWIVALDHLDERVGYRYFGEDFVPSFWQPWDALRTGQTPYPDAAEPLAQGSPFLYPPLFAEATIPMAWLPYGVAFVLYVGALAAAAALTLWALRVREPLLWLLWLLSAAVVGSLTGGNATLVVVLAVALVWRWRDQPRRCAAALAVGLTLKLFIWPVVLWLLFTRRYRAAAYATVTSALLILGSWAVIGFEGLGDYATILDRTSETLGPNGLLAYALVAKAGSHPIAMAAGLIAAGLLLTAAALRRDDDRASITLALLAALYATPILWLHYLGLLVVPAALYGGLLWATIPLLGLSRLAPVGEPRPWWLIACFVVMTAAVAWQAFRSPRHEPARGSQRVPGATT